jgi:4-hydroxybenzoate polyprenyltransferase
MVALFYAGAVVLWATAGLIVGGGPVLLLAMVVPAALLGWLVASLDRNVALNPYVRFHANQWVGLALTAALLIEAWT